MNCVKVHPLYAGPPAVRRCVRTNDFVPATMQPSPLFPPVALPPEALVLLHRTQLGSYALLWVFPYEHSGGRGPTFCCFAF